MSELSIAAVALGVVRHALDEFALARRVWRDALATRTPSHVEAGEVSAACALSVAKCGTS